MTKITSKQIIDAVGNKFLKLNKVCDTYQFSYFDVYEQKSYDHDTGFKSLSAVSFEKWLDIATDFLEEVVTPLDNMSFVKIDNHDNGVDVKIVNSDQYYDLQVPFEIDEDTTYYLIVVEYTTGDSFNTDPGNFCNVEMYIDRELAYENAQKIRDHDDNKQDGILELTMQNGKQVRSPKPWIGHFESLDNIFVYPVTIGKQVKKF